MDPIRLEDRITLLELQVAKLISKEVNSTIINEAAKIHQAYLERLLNSYDPRKDF